MSSAKLVLTTLPLSRSVDQKREAQPAAGVVEMRRVRNCSVLDASAK